LEDIVPFALLILSILFIIVLVLAIVTGRRLSPYIDLNRVEMEILLKAQESHQFRNRTEGAKPQGKPLFKKGVIRRVRVYQNGVMAPFGRIGYTTSGGLRSHSRPVAIVKVKRRFVPFNAISGVFPIQFVRLSKTVNITKRSESPVYGEHNDEGIQIETADLETAVMLQWALKKWREELGAFKDALMRAMGQRWYSLYRSNEVLRGLEFHKIVVKETTGMDEDGDMETYTTTVSRTRYLLMDIHKHEFLRGSPGYQRARRYTMTSLGADVMVGSITDWLT
jgi:hypothetical protein